MPVQLEKQVIEVEQFYQSNGNIQGNNSKGGPVVKEKVREKHLIATKKPLQDASLTETAAAKRMQELVRQFATILRQASANILRLFFMILFVYCGFNKELLGFAACTLYMNVLSSGSP